MKKNIIYDLINNNNVKDIPLNSAFQWYYLEWLKNDIDIILKNNIKICNLFTEPVHTKKIIKIFNEIYNIDYKFNIDYLKDDKPIRKYNTCTKYSIFFSKNNKYIKEQNEILNSIREYLKFEKIDKSQLCVSNICVNKISQLQFGSILKLFGIKNVQIAPTKIIESWNDLSNINLDLYKKLDLNVYSFQSITYTLNNLNIFDLDTHTKLYDHLIKVIDCAEKNNIKILVFGCPRNRKILNLSHDNDEIFVNFFKKIGDYLSNKNIIICLENNSKKYNCNFMNTINECSKIVRKINKKNIKMMVDLGNAVMENDNWYYLKDNIDIIYNIDVAHPYMDDFLNVHESNEIFNFVLKNNHYNKVINLEMLIKDNNELDILCKSLKNYINTYGI